MIVIKVGFDGTRCVGFLRYLVQVIGAEEGRPAVLHHEKAMSRPSESIHNDAAAE